jgi:hypothetical protein
MAVNDVVKALQPGMVCLFVIVFESTSFGLVSWGAQGFGSSASLKGPKLPHR